MEAIPANSKPDWQKISEEDGITVYRREMAGSAIVSFRGKADINATLPKVVGILLDTTRATEWTDDLVESRVLRWIHWPTEYVEYNHVGTPIPMKDRDFVSLVRVSAHPEKGELEVSYADVPPLTPPLQAPKTDHIRGELSGSGFILRSIAEGRKTTLDGWIQCDPKGSIPKWIVNYFQKGWPRNTLEAIRAQALKPDVKEHPYFKSLFEKFLVPRGQRISIKKVKHGG
jgi:hypothetical protein